MRSCFVAVCIAQGVFPNYTYNVDEMQPITKGIVVSQKTDLIDAACEIADLLPSGQDMAFTHSILCYVGLPRSRVAGDTFLRRSSQAWLRLQAGMLDEGRGPVTQCVPYGALPRLALAYVSTYAVRHRVQDVPIGDSAREFLRIMGMSDDGHRYASLRKQMHALAACRIQVGWQGRTFNGQAIERFDAWQKMQDQQRALWPGELRLSDAFYRSLLDAAVPLDRRALEALKGSALALDIYMWLAHRLHRIEGAGVTLRWKVLRDQFAQEYQGKDADKDFRKKFLPALKKVLLVYPNARVKQVEGGVLLQGSPPPISYRGE